MISLSSIAGFAVKNPLLSIVSVALVAVCMGWGWDHWQTTRELERAKEVQSELILQVAEQDSILAIVGTRNENLLEDIREMSEGMGRLAQNLQATESDNVRLTELLATARAELSDTGTVHHGDTVRVCERCLVEGDSVSGTLQDDIFSADWVFYPLNELRAKITANVPARMVSVELPDDRIAVFAESTNPNVDLQVERFEFTPPRGDSSTDWSDVIYGFIGGSATTSIIYLIQ